MIFYEGVFDKVYENGGWSKVGSGPGSDVEICRNYIDFVEKFVKNCKVKRVLDIGCGDWQFSQFIDWGNAEYHGIDIVESVIENNKKYETDKIKFSNNDIFGVDFDYDLVICKDVLMHLPPNEIRLILDEIVHFQKAKHFIITNDVGRKQNRQRPVVDLGGRGLDITKDPYSYKAFNINLFNGKKITQYK